MGRPREISWVLLLPGWAALVEDGGQASTEHKEGPRVLGRDLTAPLTVQVEPGDPWPGRL